MAERPEETETELDIGPEPISPAAAIAIGVHRGRKRPAADPEFDAFLRKQGELVDLQKEHLHEQRALILSRLRWGRYSDRMKALLQTLGVAFGAAIVVGLGVLAWRAHADHGLLVEAFSAPPSFAQRGVGGEVVAADVVNKLSAIVSVVRSHSWSSTNGAIQEASDDIKVEIPETGVSLTQVWRVMRDWLGSERRVTGTVRESADSAVTLTANLEGNEVVTASGPPSDLDALEQQIAEKLYAATDPINTVVYLAVQGRKTEAMAAAAYNAATAHGRISRADAFALWANLYRDPNQRLHLARIALGVDPGLLAGYYDLAATDLDLGHDEAALALARQMPTLKDADQPPQQRGKGAVEIRASARAWIETLTGNFAAASRDDLSSYGNDAGSQNALIAIADDDARLHETTAAAALLTEAATSGTFSIGYALGPYPSLATRYDADAARDDWPAALGDAWALNADDDTAAARDPDAKAGLIAIAQRRYRPLLAQARAHTGDLAGAAATISGTPLDCYDCLRLRGRIAALSGDAVAAESWFAEAVRQGPSLPFADADWGEMLLRKGDAAGAIVKLEQAHKLGPHFADPLELWGEALTAKRDYAGAVRKFAEADKDAPKWGRNHLRWGEALMLSGRYGEARAQYQVADGLDLSKPDRAALNILLARTASGPLRG